MTDDRVEIEIREPEASISWKRRIIRAVIAIVVLAAGIAVMRTLVSMKPEAAKKDKGDTSPIVETTGVTVGRQRVDVIASGVVVPARQVVIAAEVGGRVTWINPQLEPGGRFPAGKALLRVDARDYKLAVEQQSAQVTLAQTELEVEKSRRRVAEKEWEAFGEKAPEGSVAIRDPQIKAAEGAVKAAQSGLRRSRLAVSKTGLVTPFPSLVLTRQVDLGQLVSPGTPLATLVGTDAFWVQVAIPVDRLSWIAIPGVSGVKDGQGATATVEQRLGDQIVRRNGHVVRLAGEVDPVGRMAKVLVQIEDPLGLDAAEPGLPLLLNSYVDVAIEGRDVGDVAEVPRTALRNDGSVWIFDDGTLRMRDVDVIWRRRDTVLVRGLAAGAAVITSPVSGAVEGMAIRHADRQGTGTAKAPTVDAGVGEP
jgi:RND family efflux transporter MFP subunit